MRCLDASIKTQAFIEKTPFGAFFRILTKFLCTKTCKFEKFVVILHAIRMHMVLKIINTSNNPLPRYESAQAAGMDIRCRLDEPVTLQPMERRLIPTGLFIELPAGYEAQIRPRSGLALKRGLTVLNTPGTIDADYRGEVGVILINLSGEPQTIEPGERICQMVIARHETPEIVEVAELSDTERGAGGFGHSGRK